MHMYMYICLYSSGCTEQYPLFVGVRWHLSLFPCTRTTGDVAPREILESLSADGVEVKECGLTHTVAKVVKWP